MSKRRTILAFFAALTIAQSATAIPAICEGASVVFASEPQPLDGDPITLPNGQLRIEINPMKNRLVLFVDNLPFKQYPIALGKPETPTPAGEYYVMNKSKNWGSGFGTRWMGLNVTWGIYGIHGTNRPHSIGRDASHGCVRMFNRHVEELYELIPIGTPVHILGHALGEPSQEPRRLAKGDSGIDVLYFQHYLWWGGYYRGEVHGKFDAETERALKAFEKEHGLPVDGVMSVHDYFAMGLLE